MKLTKRQNEIAEQVTNGLTDEQIADKLFISAGTAKWHVKKIIKKNPEVYSRVDIAREYILTNPQKFFVAIIFLLMQSVISVYDTGLELRRPRVQRIVRVNRTGKRVSEYIMD